MDVIINPVSESVFNVSVTAGNIGITSLTTTGNSGASTLLSNVLNVPNYTLSGLGGIKLSSVLTGYVVGADSDILSTNTILQAFEKAQGQINARIRGSISTGHVAFGSTTNNIGGDSGFTWNNTLKVLDILGSTSGIIRVRGNTTGGAFYVNGVNSAVTACAFGISDSITGSVPSGSNILWSSSSLYFNTGSNTRFFIGENGLNGILTTSPTNTFDVNGSARIRSVANATGDFATYSATGVLQKRTALQSSDDILKSISGYNAAVAQRLEHTSLGVINWVNI